VTTTYGFGLDSPRKLLDKAHWELEQLRSVIPQPTADRNDQVVAYVALNTAWTIWHITDWIAASPDPRARALMASLGASSLETLQHQLKTRYPIFLNCWELATGAKHAVLRGKSKQKAKNLNTSVSTGAAFMIVDPVGRAQNVTPVQPKVQEPGSAKVRVTDLYRQLLIRWEQLFRQHGL
jgi:hypothetical protein